MSMQDSIGWYSVFPSVRTITIGFIGGSFKTPLPGQPNVEGAPTMARCDVCGNDYDKSFEVIAEGESHTFDSFECAIHMLAPRCAHCDCRVIGHGVEADNSIYC